MHLRASGAGLPVVVRDASNVEEVLGQVLRRTGVRMHVMSGEEEVRLTLIAARQWFGWSAGPLLLLDIGGGSAEVAWSAGAADRVARVIRY
jgi:exopolyphosphatase/guanosine-5'-triphosphate,3'-diphosphate pyrophosphatase